MFYDSQIVKSLAKRPFFNSTQTLPLDRLFGFWLARLP